MIEYRICWSASSNITFRGESDWLEWGDEDATEDDVQNEISSGSGGSYSDGLELALELSGFEWWAETRVVVADAPERKLA